VPIPSPDSATTPANAPIRIDVLGNDADVISETLDIQNFAGTSALGGTVTRSVGTGPGGRDELLFAPGGAGADSFSYTVSNGTASAVGTVSVMVVDAAQLRPGQLVAGIAGLDVRYYDLDTPIVLPDFESLTSFHQTVWTEVDFAESGDDFADTFRMDDVGAVATGLLNVPVDGFYTLSLESSDGSRLFVGDDLLIDNDGLQGMHRESGVIGLRAGAHPIRIEYFERLQVCGLVARIAGPGLPEQSISGAMLSHVLPNPADFNADGFITPDDLSDFITCFFITSTMPGTCPAADFNGDGFIDPDDLSDFIVAFFT
jgi:hypothetical protein